MKKLVWEITRVRLPDKDAIHPEVLRAHVRTQILPLRIFRVVWRLDRIRTNMAKSARHAHAIRPDQVLVVIVGRIFIVALRVPSFGRGSIKIRIRKETQAHDSRWITIVGTYRYGSATRPNLDARVLLLILKWIGGTISAAL